MKKLELIIGILLFVSSVVWAQDGHFPASKAGTGTVFGKVMDEVSQKGLAYANVAMYQQGTKQPITAKTTNDSGRFIFRDVAYGRYHIEISYLGMETYQSGEVIVDKAHPAVRLGKLFLAGSDQVIAEAQVTGEKSTEEVSLVKKVFNVSKNINNAGGSALDAMRNIPSLSVGIDGDVQLRGSSNVKILVNGRPSSLVSTGGELKLDQLPAASIEAIEVITNPSAKYEASGKTGIINIILKKPTDYGFNYNFNFLAGQRDKWTTGLTMNYRTNHWNWRAGYQFNRNTYQFTKVLDQQSFRADTTYFLEENSTAEKVKTGHTVSLGMDWNPTKQWSLFTTFSVNPHIGQKASVFDYTYFNQDHIYDNNSLRKTQDDEEEMGVDVELGINKKFSRKGMSWNTVYSYDNGNKLDSVLSNHHYYDMNDLLALTNEKNRRDQVEETHRVQSDFVYPFSRKVKMETGLMYSYRNLENDFRYADLVNDIWEPNLGRTNDFLYSEHIGAAYLMGTAHIQKWSFNAGLRVENTDVNSVLAGGSQQYPNHYINFFPSGHIGLDVLPEGKGTILLSYSRRIKRPSYRRLNPFASFNDNQNIRRGNPLLRPELSDSWELGWQSRWKKGSVSPAVFYRKTIDKVGYYTHLLDNGIRELTFVNLNSGTAQGAEVNGSYNPLKWLRLSGNVSYFHIEKDGTNLENATTNVGDMFMTRLLLMLTPKKPLAIQVSGFYNSGYVGTLGESDAIANVDLGITYMAFHNRGKFIFRVTDIFNTRRFAMHIKTPDLNMEFERKRESQILWLGFNWELKHTKNQNRRRKKSSGGGDMEF